MAFMAAIRELIHALGMQWTEFESVTGDLHSK